MRHENDPIVIGMRERQEREYNKGETYFFFVNEEIKFGELDGPVDNKSGLMYLKVETTDKRGRPAIKWYMIHRRWLMTPNDTLSLLN